MIDKLDGDNTNTAPYVVELDRAEAMELLASVDYGRVVFTQNALPAIRVVNHIVDQDAVIMRTQLATKLSTVVRARTSPGVLAYQADDLDRQAQLGWSVVVTGRAHTVTDPGRLARYEQLLRPWVNDVMDTVIAIDAEIVTGIRIVSDNPAPAPHGRTGLFAASNPVEGTEAG